MSTIDHIRGTDHRDAVFGARRASTLVAAVLSMDRGSLLERRRSRLALLEMTDDQLKDIGVSRSEAYREANRPFWD